MNTAFKLSVFHCRNTVSDIKLTFEAQILQAQLLFLNTFNTGTECKNESDEMKSVACGTHCCKYACITDDSKGVMVFVVYDL